MKKLLFLLFTLGSCFSFTISAQENTINRIPEVSNKTDQELFSTYNKGFWIAAEGMAGYSSHLHGHNMGLAEIDVTGGYRFNQYIKAGIGLGVRYYINSKHLRRHNSSWGMPLYVSARGNLMPETYRRVVPFWSMDLGGSIRDGFMMRPSVGIRIGESRQALTLALSYMGQSIASTGTNGDKTQDFTSFFCLRIGFEY